MRFFLYAGTAFLLLAAQPAAYANDPARGARTVDPDWPCVQRRVPTLSATQLWDGPAVDGLSDWNQDEAIRNLIPVLASRRVPEEEAIAQLKDFAVKLAPAERNAKLTLLFAGLLAAVNTERSTIINGIIRFEQRQRARSKELEREGTRIAELKAKAATDDKAKGELDSAQELFDWNVRVFQERQSNTPIACEIPVMMEARIFDMAREIRALMAG